MERKEIKDSDWLIFLCFVMCYRRICASALKIFTFHVSGLKKSHVIGILKYRTWFCTWSNPSPCLSRICDATSKTKNVLSLLINSIYFTLLPQKGTFFFLYQFITLIKQKIKLFQRRVELLHFWNIDACKIVDISEVIINKLITALEL